MLQRTFPAGFIAPCLPTKTDKLVERAGRSLLLLDVLDAKLVGPPREQFIELRLGRLNNLVLQYLY
jgi:hypothetical protein